VVRFAQRDRPLKELIDEFAEELYCQEPETNFEKKYVFNEEAFLIDSLSNFKMQVRGVLIGGHYKVDKNHQEIRGEDHVWLIMQSLFDNRLIVISPTGEITVKKLTEF